VRPAGKFALFLWAASAPGAVLLAAPSVDDEESSLTPAICPIVYQIDETPSSRGYHYTFYGNAFFINDEGYLLTAAHVLETFHHGSQPSIQLQRPNRPPQLLRLTVVATDAEHDVAILRVIPNPFSGHYRVTFLPLAADPAVGQAVLALSLHPVRLQNAQSFQVPAEERSPGEVLAYESTELSKSAPPSDVFLWSHPVTLGQSGSPVLAAGSHAVVGLVEGRWLRSSAASLGGSKGPHADAPGAAVPVRYAIALLNQKGVHWQAAERDSRKLESPAK